MALKALSEFAVLMSMEKTNIQVTVRGPHLPNPIHFDIETHSRLLLQSAEVWTRAVI